MEEGGLFHLHEGHVAVDVGQRPQENGGNDGRGGEIHEALHRAGHGCMDNVEPDHLIVAQHEGITEQDAPQPGDRHILQRPADREVEEIAEDDLDQKASEHAGQQQDDEKLCGPVQAAPETGQLVHGMTSTGMACCSRHRMAGTLGRPRGKTVPPWRRSGRLPDAHPERGEHRPGMTSTRSRAR